MMQRKPPGDKGHIRENYEAPSHKYSDWVQRLGVAKSPLIRLLVYLQEKVFFRQLSLVFLFAFLTAQVLNFDVQPDLDYQVGDVAKSDIVSPISFDVIDELTTEERRNEAQAQVPIILDYDPHVFDRVSAGVYRAFRQMRARLRGLPPVRGLQGEMELQKEMFKHKSEFEREVGFSTNDYIFEWWVENRFNARYEAVLIRSLEQWYQWKVTDGAEKYIPPKTTVVLAREISKSNEGREFHIRTEEIHDISQYDHFQLKDLRGIEKIDPLDLQTLLRFGRALLEPNLTLNKQEIENRKQQARKTVLPIHVAIKRGQLVAAEGTIISPLHKALIEEIDRRKSERSRIMHSISMALLVTLVSVIFFQYLRRASGLRLKLEMKDVWVMGIVLLAMIILCKTFLFLVENALFTHFGNQYPNDMFFYLAPLATGAMLVGLLIQSAELVWVFAALVAVVVGLMSEMNFSYMLVTFVSGISGARGVMNCKARNDIYWAGVRAGLTSAVAVALIGTVSHFDHEDYFIELLAGIPAGFIGGILSSLVAMMTVPLLETLFNYTTDVRLLELSNLNHPLLKEMIVKAPGTYHHSMLVGSMVEAAAEEIGANPLLGKVMCYYHDIGKVEHARYFIENQKPGNNPHDHISPYMSRTLLVAHVKDGAELGMKYKLGTPIIDGVLQHHGTTLISFFYNKAIDQNGEGGSEVPEDEFRYPGPKPQFREAALCMLADSIEAAGRSLDEPTPVRLQNIVRNIVQKKFIDGQLDECSLTLKDLSKVEAAFTRILLGIYHQRIDYPRGLSASETAPVSPWATNDASGSGSGGGASGKASNGT